MCFFLTMSWFFPGKIPISSIFENKQYLVNTLYLFEVDDEDWSFLTLLYAKAVCNRSALICTQVYFEARFFCPYVRPCKRLCNVAMSLLHRSSEDLSLSEYILTICSARCKTSPVEKQKIQRILRFRLSSFLGTKRPLQITLSVRRI